MFKPSNARGYGRVTPGKSFQAGVQKLLRNRAATFEEIRHVAAPTLQKIVMEARELVPKATGNLERSIQVVQPPERFLLGVVTSNVVYAALQHEVPPPENGMDLIGQTFERADRSTTNKSTHESDLASLLKVKSVGQDGLYFRHDNHGRYWEPRTWKYIEIPMYAESGKIFEDIAADLIPILRRQM